MSSLLVCLFHTRYNSPVHKGFYKILQSVTMIMAVALSLFYTLVRPTVKRPVQDPLAVLLLNGRL